MIPVASIAGRVPPAPPPSIRPILAVNFVGALGFSIVLPFLIFLVTRLGGNALVYGVMGATYSAFQLVGAPILGRWSDRFGRRRILLLSQLGTLTAWAVFLGALFLPVTPLVRVDAPVVGAFTLTVPLVVLFFARALDGITGGNVSVANAYLADVTADEERSASFGRMAVAANLGFVVGPATAGLLGAVGLSEVWAVAAALLVSVVAMAIIAFTLDDVTPCVLTADPEHLSVRKVMGQEQKECFELAGDQRLSGRAILALPAVGRLIGIQFLVFLAFNFFYVAFPVHAATRLDWSLADTGVFFAFMGLMMAVVQGPVLIRASALWPEHRLAVAGGLILALGFLFFLSPERPQIYLGTAVVALGNGLMWPSLQSLLSRSSDRSLQGSVQGFASSAGAMASIAGLLAGGLLYGWVGAGVFALSASIVGLALALSLGAWRSEPAR
jgi:MFS family permease